jgi:hypothetical protein
VTTPKKIGICKLTGHRGRFVKSHLIPAALTRPEFKDAFLVQAGLGERPIKRWTSWYDPALVTAEGERILAAHDGAGIAELSRHKLLWSSWGPMLELNTPDLRRYAWGMGVRRLQNVDGRTLRIFFLSLLWRAAATNLREFSQVEISPDHMDQLRHMILSGTAEPYKFFPAQLIQLSTRGMQHNYSPIVTTKQIPAAGEHQSYNVPILRFYFDGLVTHFDTRPSDEQQDYGPLSVGPNSELFVTTMTYEESFQGRRLADLQAHADAQWPDLIGKLL